MKVALVTDWYHPRVGGIELHLQDLARRLTIAGIDVVIVTPTRGDDTAEGIRIRRIDAPLAPHFGFLCTRAGVRTIGEVLSDERVDVAHCHVSIVSPAALGGAAEAQRRGIPTVLTFHSIVPQTRVLAGAMRMALGTAHWGERASVEYTAVSGRVAREVSPFTAGRRVTVLANGVDVDFWKNSVAPAVNGASHNARVELVTVMRLNSKKRPLALVDLMLTLGQMLGNEPRMRLRVAGDGPQRNALERAIRRSGMSERVELLGVRTREEIRGLLAASDVFVLPAVRESFGLAAVEARCVGIPVVAMAASGVAEVITHGREGLLARSDAEMAVHVARLARDAELRSTIATHNRETIPACGWLSTIKSHLRLYTAASTAYRDATALRESVCADTKQ